MRAIPGNLLPVSGGTSAPSEDEQPKAPRDQEAGRAWQRRRASGAACSRRRERRAGRARTGMGRRRLSRFQRRRRYLVSDQQRRGGADRRHPGRADQEDPGALAGDAVMSDVHALAAASAEVRTCRVCGLADPPPDPTCRDGRDHRVGTAAGCPHCGRLPQACARRPCFGSMHEAARRRRSWYGSAGWRGGWSRGPQRAGQTSDRRIRPRYAEHGPRVLPPAGRQGPLPL